MSDRNGLVPEVRVNRNGVPVRRWVRPSGPTSAGRSGLGSLPPAPARDERLSPLAAGASRFRGAAAKEFMGVVAEEMAKAGMGRTSRYNGGEITGETDAFGSTGFSVRRIGDRVPVPSTKPRDPSVGHLLFHVVVSGKDAGLTYETYRDIDGSGDAADFHEPRNPERLHGRIEQVFRGLGLDVTEVTTSGWQTLWDDDVEYNIFAVDPEAAGR